MSDSVHKLLNERGKRYNVNGSYADHARTTVDLQDVMRQHRGWVTLPHDVRQSLDMTQHKIGRIINGDPSYADNYEDIIGYMQLILYRLADEQQEASNV